MRHKSATSPLIAKTTPQPLPVVTKYFIAKKNTLEAYDDRIFDLVDDAHKARDELGDKKKDTYILSFNQTAGGKRLTSNKVGAK
jgi:hypothetical protein